jgi:hypothetical protein
MVSIGIRDAGRRDAIDSSRMSFNRSPDGSLQRLHALVDLRPGNRQGREHLEDIARAGNEPPSSSAIHRMRCLIALSRSRAIDFFTISTPGLSVRQWQLASVGTQGRGVRPRRALF